MAMRADDDMTAPPKAAAPPDAIALTYRDVQVILALLDSWRSGHVRLAKGDLAVDATLDAGPASGSPFWPPASRFVVRSPTVGIFQPASSAAEGTPVRDKDVVGSVVAPGRTTPVAAGASGKLTEVLVAAGEFVEYGQALAAISTIAE